MGVLKVENRMQKVSKRLFFEVCSRRIQINSLGVSRKFIFFQFFVKIAENVAINQFLRTFL